MDYFLFRRLSSGQPIQELALTVGANQLVGSDATGLLKTFSFGGAGGILQLDENGKVPLSALPAAAIQTVQTAANQAARFALTAAQVQVGDLVKQSDDGSYHEVIDEGNLANANGWLKRNMTDEIDELNYTLANGATQTVTITKKLTIINVEPPANAAHSAILLVIGGSGGEIVCIQKPSLRGFANTGSIQVRSYLGTSTSQTVLATLNSVAPGHQTMVLQRSFGTIPLSVPLFRQVLRTSAHQIVNVYASGATSAFYQPTVSSVRANGALPGYAVLQNQFGNAFNDGDVVTLATYDFGSSVLASASFEFDKNSTVNEGNTAVAISESADIWECWGALYSAIAGYGFSGAFESGTDAGGYPNMKFTGDANTMQVSFSSTNSYAAYQSESVNGTPATGGTILTLPPGARLLELLAQHGPSGGIDQGIIAQLYDGGSTTKTLFSFPTGGAGNQFFTLKDATWEPGAVEWLSANVANPNAVISFYQENMAAAGVTELQVHYGHNSSVGVSVSGI